MWLPCPGKPKAFAIVSFSCCISSSLLCSDAAVAHAPPSGVSPESIAIGSGNGMAGGNGTALTV